MQKDRAIGHASSYVDAEGSALSPSPIASAVEGNPRRFERAREIPDSWGSALKMDRIASECCQS